MAKPKIFISHCESNFVPAGVAIRTINLLGCIPVVAESQPKLSRTVHGLVCDSLETCDAAVVIATGDREVSGGKEPSQGVLVEIGQLQKLERFKGKYFIIKERGVTLGPMIPEARYNFDGVDFFPIVEAILIELGSMGFFKNYYELPGSDMQMHDLIETLANLRDLGKRGVLNKEAFEDAVKNVIVKMVEAATLGVCT